MQKLVSDRASHQVLLMPFIRKSWLSEYYPSAYRANQACRRGHARYAHAAVGCEISHQLPMELILVIMLTRFYASTGSLPPRASQ